MPAPKKKARRPRPTPEASPRASATGPSAPKGGRNTCLVVGIGGSAGSLEPLCELLGALGPAPLPVAFIIVIHRAPRNRELMSKVLERHTRMPVVEAADGMLLEEGTIYLVPPQAGVGIRDGTIRLGKQATPSANLTIDILFRAMSEDCGPRAIAVILSGMGTDGTLGAAAVRQQSGTVLVQTPAGADYDVMPTSAIAAGLADFIGTPTELARRLESHAGAYHQHSSGERPDITPVLALVRAHTGHDFTHYKRSTLERRIGRRMALERLTSIDEYLALLRRAPLEIEKLFSELLIGVTRFFRDREAFDALALSLRDVVRVCSATRPLRAWVAGCATGEEAYSLAIVIRELWEELRGAEPVHVQLYATDLDRKSIERARRAHYPPGIAADVTPERLARFFTPDNGGYRVRSTIRDMIVFATHNIVSDPPFTKLDVLSSRNVLIYLEPELQRRVLALFLYALSPGGRLLIGTSEGINGLDESFVAIDPKLKLFGRRATSLARTTTPELTLGHLRDPAYADALPTAAAHAARSQNTLIRAVVDHFAPPIIVVDERGTLLYASTRMGRFLEPPAGKANANVFAMARPGLSLALRAAVRKALGQGKRVTERGIMRTRGRETRADVTALPLVERGFEGCAMVAFTELDTTVRAKTRTPRGDATALAELRRAKRQLDALMQEMEHSQEDLRGVNEELQSANEELQSANEELTTSKEEMQSMNEELLTLNGELQITNEQLSTTNDDMRNLLNSSQIPTLFLDRELRLKRFTAQASRIANLLPADVGRPITDLTWNVRYETLARDAKEVARTLVFLEVEVEANDGSVYTMRIHPYRTTDDLIDGVVITFVDITAQKKAALVLSAHERQEILDKTIRSWPGIAYVEDRVTGRTVAVSDATRAALGYPRAMIEGAPDDFWKTIRRSRGTHRTTERGRVELRRSDGTTVPYLERTTILKRADGEPAQVLHVFRRVKA